MRIIIVIAYFDITVKYCNYGILVLPLSNTGTVHRADSLLCVELCNR